MYLIATRIKIIPYSDFELVCLKEERYVACRVQCRPLPPYQKFFSNQSLLVVNGFNMLVKRRERDHH